MNRFVATRAPRRRRWETIQIFRSLFVVNARNRRGSYADLFFSGLTVFLRIWIFAAMYQAAFASSTSKAYVSAVWAVSISQAIFSLDRPDPTLSIGQEIKDGSIVGYLLRPMNYVQYNFVSYWGRSIPALISNSVFCIAAAVFLTRSVPETSVHIVLSFVPIILGIAVVILIAILLGLFGFWTHDTGAFNWISHKMALLFGGLIIPLTLMPDTVQSVMSVLPWTVGLARPAKLITDFSYDYYLTTVGLQIFWIATLYSVANYVMNRGFKKLNVSGG